YRTDVYDEPRDAPGVVTVTDRRGRHLGQALHSPASEIRLRLLTTGREPIDATWWADRIAAAARRRARIPATAYRAVHGEGDGLPSLVVDRYGPYVVAQLLSAGLERVRADVLDGIDAALAPEGILLRNDTTVRRHEGLPLEVALARGTVPAPVAVEEAGVRYLAAPRPGQRPGAFRDQRENRAPPAFAKSKQSVPRALAGYKEINLRAMRLVAPGGVLFTCSCSYYVTRAVFLDMLGDAARDAGRRLQLLAVTGAGQDHPELVNVP